MKQVIVNAYQYDELSDWAKEKVLAKFREWMTEDDFNSEYIFDNWKDKLETMSYTEVKISYTGFNRQGDGASFTGDIDNILEYMKAHKLSNKYRLLYDNTRLGNISLSCTIQRINYHYSHEQSVKARVDYEFYDYDHPVSSDKWKRFMKQIKELESFIQDQVHDISCDIYSELQKDYEYIMSEENIKDMIEINEYLFDQNGKII